MYKRYTIVGIGPLVNCQREAIIQEHGTSLQEDVFLIEKGNDFHVLSKIPPIKEQPITYFNKEGPLKDLVVGDMISQAVDERVNGYISFNDSS